jgi:hypothetical protein
VPLNLMMRPGCRGPSRRSSANPPSPATLRAVETFQRNVASSEALRAVETFQRNLASSGALRATKVHDLFEDLLGDVRFTLFLRSWEFGEPGNPFRHGDAGDPGECRRQALRLANAFAGTSTTVSPPGVAVIGWLELCSTVGHLLDLRIDCNPRLPQRPPRKVGRSRRRSVATRARLSMRMLLGRKPLDACVS